ncbi:MAG: hypothetical protein R2784_13425 [Saprospiraceae bacterium]
MWPMFTMGAFYYYLDSNVGGTPSTTITIPTTGGGYNYDIDWENDGVYDEFGVTGSITHNYGAGGTYQVAIGLFPRIYFNFTGDRQRSYLLIEWGGIEWASMNNAFSGDVQT